MSTTVEQLYQTVCYDLLEDAVNGPGLSLGMVTQQEFLNQLGIVLMDFLRSTGIIWSIFTQPIKANVSYYLSPNQMPKVFYVFSNASIVEKDTLFSSYMLGQWKRQPGQAKAYHEDGLPIKTLELIPAPNLNGTTFTPTVGPPPPFGQFDTPTNNPFMPGDYNLTLVGSSLASKETWDMGDTLDTIPDSFTPYLVFGILAKIFGMDGECRDQQRAAYCAARYSEGVLLGRSLFMEMLGESAQQGGRSR